MWRYARLYAYFLRFSFSRAMEFRFDFFFRIFMDVCWYLVHIGLFEVLYLHTPLFGGWNPDQMWIFLAGVFVADATYMSVFANNLWMLPFMINHGDLDYYVVRPVSSLFFLTLRDFAANSFVNLLMTVGFFVFALVRFPGELTLLGVALFVSMLALGIVLHFLLSLIFLTPVFWMHSGMGLRELSFGLDRYASKPDAIYRGLVRRVLTTVLPFAIIVSFPTRALFAAEPWPIVLHMVVVTVVFFVVAVAFWRRGVKAYSSASS